MIKFVVAVSVLLSLLTPSIALADHSLKVTNDGAEPAEYLYVSAPEYTQWGDDLFGDDFVLEPQHWATFTITEGCLEDIKVVWEDDHSSVWKNFDTCQYDLVLHYDGS